MESRVSKLQNYTVNKFKDAASCQKDSARQGFGGSDCIDKHTATATASVVSESSKYFSGSSLTSALKSQPLFSYHRDGLKLVSFTTSEKQMLVSDVHKQQQQLASPNDGDINWAAITLPNKSDIQCLMKFRNDSDPEISHGKWTPAEEKSLLVAVDAHSERNWCRVADAVSVQHSLKRRTPMQCLQHYQLNFNKGLIRPTEWSADEEKVLLDAAALYGARLTAFAE
jgi:hypothetical protein